MLCVLMLLGFSGVLAGPTHQALGQVSSPPDGCDVPLRSFEDVTRLIQLGRLPHPASTVPLDGAIARQVTAEDVRVALMQFVACSGAGEPLRVWSLYTDAYLARLLSRERGYDRVRYDLDAVPRPVVDSAWPVLTALGGIGVDTDGRIVANATMHYPNLERTKHLRFWFVWQDGRLRIDEVDGEITFAVP